MGRISPLQSLKGNDPKDLRPQEQTVNGVDPNHKYNKIIINIITENLLLYFPGTILTI